MTQTWWTPAMMFAWAIWRDPTKVEWAWYINAEQAGHNPLSAKDVLWFAESDHCSSRSHDKDSRRRAAGSDKDFSYRYNPSFSNERCVREIADALTNGRIRGFGTPPGSTTIQDLSERDWIGVDLGSIKIDDQIHDALYVVGSSSPRMLSVRVLSEDVLREWPDPSVVFVGATDPAIDTFTAPQTPRPILSNEAQMRALATETPMPAGLSKVEYVKELAKRAGRSVNRDIARQMHENEYFEKAKQGRPRKLAQ